MGVHVKNEHGGLVNLPTYSALKDFVEDPAVQL